MSQTKLITESLSHMTYTIDYYFVNFQNKTILDRSKTCSLTVCSTGGVFPIT